MSNGLIERRKSRETPMNRKNAKTEPKEHAKQAKPAK